MREPKPVLVNVHMPERTKYVDRNVTVHEHRAPTDESVRLLKEMEEEAREKILDSFRLDGNGFECVIQCERDCMTMDTTAVAVFSLNGRKFQALARVTDRERQRDGPVLLASRLRDAVALSIANEVLSGAWPRELPR